MRKPRPKVQEGDTYGRLTVLAEGPPETRGRRTFHVRCSCGTEKVVRESNLQAGNTLSCGCYRLARVREAMTQHGSTRNGQKTPEYEAWVSMMARCYSENTDSYPYYGGKGVRVHPEWHQDFQAFRLAVGERPTPEHRLSRRDPNRDFDPENTYWATQHEIGRRRPDNTFYTVGSRTQCLVDWAKEYGIPKNTLHYRVVTKGMTMRDALDVGRGRQGQVLP
jgi:hypothetical protein